MYSYDVLTEEEAMKERYSLMGEGTYEAVVMKCFGKMSQSNNPMAEIWLNVYDAQGHLHTVRDYIPFTRKMGWKLKHFCDALGLSKEYAEQKFVPEMAQDRNLKVLIKIQAGNEIPEDKLNGKPLGTKYPDKNVIEDYVIQDMKDGCFPKKDDFVNDDLPF